MFKMILMAKFDYFPRYGGENYSFVTSYELSFDMVGSTEWMQKNWIHSITLSFIYILAIFGGQKLMTNRKPFALDQTLFWWNIFLATFSAIGAARMSINSNSFFYSICIGSYAQGVSGYWGDKFAMSKVFEFADTAFIVLRKKPLIFLHWYHHVTVLISTWMMYKDHAASGRWFIAMNYVVHSFMYTYYALRALQFKLPRWTAIFVTLLQISQMIVGLVISIYTFRLKSVGIECQNTWTNLYVSFLIYSTYFLLFCNFFYQTYLRSGNRYTNRKIAKTSEKLTNGNSVVADVISSGELLEPIQS
ncbi:Elongation of very long chain fatty acids protein [Meloidogyne graminicola]|uniref:Elongation of very long chain fatty acids protein n=1 Tax=Meloidogyne graminicola TaxID=189291 RepID=A0A8S9ZXB6_9BILA|nr:Elongation of very long chain fatty acids protein [Meloidogyne graminicola]